MAGPLDPWPEFHVHELLERLGEGDVDFVIIGGIAAVLLGSPTVTHDLDICFSAQPENLEALGAVLTDLDARLWGVEADVPFTADARTLAKVDLLTLETRAGRIDVMRRPAGAPVYEELRSRAEVVELRGRTFRVANIDDLITMKRAAGRPKDLAAATELEAIVRLRSELADE